MKRSSTSRLSGSAQRVCRSSPCIDPANSATEDPLHHQKDMWRDGIARMKRIAPERGIAYRDSRRLKTKPSNRKINPKTWNRSPTRFGKRMRDMPPRNGRTKFGKMIDSTDQISIHILKSKSLKCAVK